jgi:hypothetical protein
LPLTRNSFSLTLMKTCPMKWGKHTSSGITIAADDLEVSAAYGGLKYDFWKNDVLSIFGKGAFGSLV